MHTMFEAAAESYKVRIVMEETPAAE